jgi:hypothetical protein
MYHTLLAWDQMRDAEAALNDPRVVAEAVLNDPRDFAEAADFGADIEVSTDFIDELASICNTPSDAFRLSDEDLLSALDSALDSAQDDADDDEPADDSHRPTLPLAPR